MRAASFDQASGVAPPGTGTSNVFNTMLINV
jgi:hypothetical protein